VGQLARDVLAKQPTVTKLVQRMADEGLLVLRADPQDQRRTLVAASEGGAEGGAHSDHRSPGPGAGPARALVRQRGRRPQTHAAAAGGGWVRGMPTGISNQNQSPSQRIQVIVCYQ
jgi:hypothetical protein